MYTLYMNTPAMWINKSSTDMINNGIRWLKLYVIVFVGVTQVSLVTILLLISRWRHRKLAWIHADFVSWLSSPAITCKHIKYVTYHVIYICLRVYTRYIYIYTYIIEHTEVLRKIIKKRKFSFSFFFLNFLTKSGICFE